MASAVRIVILAIVSLSSLTNCQEGILHISDGVTEKEFCIVHNHSWTPLAQSLDMSLAYPLLNLTSQLLCNSSGVTPDSVKGKAVVVMRGDCDFSQKALIAQKLGATILLIASNTTLITPSANESEYAKITIPLALMRYRDFLLAQKVFTGEMQVKLYAPPQVKIDPSILVMLLIAVITVALGGFWSGACERERLTMGRDEGQAESKTDTEISIFSPLKVLLLVLVMCGMLVLMYYFYKILVYVIIAIFCVASANALFFCFDALLDKIGCGTIRFSVRNWNLSVRSIILASVCIVIAVIWGVYRNEDRWIWVLQDILGIAFCLNFIRTISLSNFKICVILLSLLLIYDVFFVFITPFFTKNGVSIMVQVALGPDVSGEKMQDNMVEVPAEPQPPTEKAGSVEFSINGKTAALTLVQRTIIDTLHKERKPQKLPVVMRVPRFLGMAQNLCGMQFSILGYGDILIPGLLIAYCSRFDVWVNSKWKVYYTSCCAAYLMGLIVTFAAMLLSGMGQPALLYLVPFTLITSAVVAGCRREMRTFWNGQMYEVLDSSREPLLPEASRDITRRVLSQAQSTQPTCVVY